MLGPLHRDHVVIYRPKGLSGRAASKWKQLTDDGDGPTELLCRIEERPRRTRGQEGDEESGEAQMVFRVRTFPKVKKGDVVLVVKTGAKYRVTLIESQRQWGTRHTYSRASLQETAVDVPNPHPAVEA